MSSHRHYSDPGSALNRMLLSWWAEASTPGTDTSTECHSRRSIAVHMAAANSAAMVERSAALCSIQVGPRVLWNMNHPITHGTQATRGGPRASHFRHSLVVSLNSPGQNKAGLPHGFMSVPAPSHFGARSTVRDPTYILFCSNTAAAARRQRLPHRSTRTLALPPVCSTSRTLAATGT